MNIAQASAAVPLDQLATAVADGRMPASTAIEEILRSPDVALQLPAAQHQAFQRLPEFSERLSKTLIARTRSVLMNEPPASASWLIRIARTFLPPEHGALRELEGMLEVVESAEHLAATADLKPLRDLIRLTPVDDRALIEVRFLRTVHKKVEEELERERMPQAFEALSLIPPTLVNDTTVSLVSKAILNFHGELKRRGEQEPTVPWPLDDEALSVLVEAVADKDPGVAQTLTEIFSWRTIAAVVQKDLNGANTAYAEVVKRRPDPNELNNDLRMEIALQASEEPMRSFARGRVEDLKIYGALTPSRKLQLLFAGYYGKTFLILLTLCGLVLLSAPLIGNFRPRWAFPEVRFPAPSLGMPRFKRKDKVVPGYLNLASRDDEYGTLLALFGLEDGADEEEIKSAYRAAIKLYHPDHIDPNLPNRDEVADRFRRMQQAYERIMDIRSSWFSGGR